VSGGDLWPGCGRGGRNLAEDYVRRLLDETREELTRADSKASIILAGAGVAIGAVLAGLVSGDVSLSGRSALVIVMTWSAGVLLTLGILCLAAAVYPRTGHPQRGHARYFGEVNLYKSGSEELGRAVDLDSVDIRSRDLQQVHALSQALSRKYTLTQAGMWLLGGGFLSAGAAAFLA
jgi:pycsar effector protein